MEFLNAFNVSINLETVLAYLIEQFTHSSLKCKANRSITDSIVAEFLVNILLDEFQNFMNT